MTVGILYQYYSKATAEFEPTALLYGEHLGQQLVVAYFDYRTVRESLIARGAWQRYKEQSANKIEITTDLYNSKFGFKIYVFAESYCGSIIHGRPTLTVVLT